MSKSIIIFDTTLRDGEQSLPASLNAREKLHIALALEKMGIDIIEAGFPVSSPGDFTAVRTVAQHVKNSKICALARCINKDIDIAAEALSIAKMSRIHVFLATSTIHLKSKLKKNFDQVIEMAVQAIKYALRYTDDVEFSCEDASRTSIDNLCRIIEAAIYAGACTINIPDTVGYAIPYQFSNIISTIINRVPNIDQAILSVHCHNDLGMATSNSISAIQAGARQIEGTINGIGERAGNAALEEIIMAIKIHSNLLDVYTNINCKKIHHTSKLVSQICNIPIPVNKAIVGTNAFMHSAGIHQDGILKNRENYEILFPEKIGLKEVKLNLNARSGRAAVKHYMQNMGYQESDYSINKLYNDFLKLADKKGQIFDYDLEALAFMNTIQNKLKYFSLESFNIQSHSKHISNASITLCCGKKIHTFTSKSNGLIDAIYEAMNNIVCFSISLDKYTLTLKNHGQSSLGQADITIGYAGRGFHGSSISTDIIEASVEAMVDALNNIWLAYQVSIKLKRIQNNHMKNNFDKFINEN